MSFRSSHLIKSSRLEEMSVDMRYLQLSAGLNFSVDPSDPWHNATKDKRKKEIKFWMNVNRETVKE